MCPPRTPSPTALFVSPLPIVQNLLMPFHNLTILTGVELTSLVFNSLVFFILVSNRRRPPFDQAFFIFQRSNSLFPLPSLAALMALLSVLNGLVLKFAVHEAENLLTHSIVRICYVCSSLVYDVGFLSGLTTKRTFQRVSSFAEIAMPAGTPW